MERQCVAVKLPLFFAEMLFEQKKKKEEALNHVKQMILEQKLKNSFVHCSLF